MEMLQFDFMRHALLAGLLVSVICGIMGTLAVANRMVFLSGGIAHAAYGGIGLAFLLRWPYLPGTLGFSLLAAITMAAASINIKHRADAVIGAIWAVGMAMGIVCIDLSRGYPADLMSYLFGSILTVARSDMWVMTVAALIITAVTWFYYADFLALSYDEEFARLRRVPVKRLYYLLVVLLALAVVLTIRVVGLILVIALLSIPPFIAEKFTRSLLQMMAWSCVLSAAFTMIGLTAAYYLNLTAGACIILAAGAGFFLSIAVDRMLKRPRAAHSKRIQMS
jgi:zinc transport system permease protein